MPTPKRALPAVLAALACVLALPALAPAKLTEVGVVEHTTPETVPSCPGNPCLAVSRTTGFQLQVDAVTSPVKITHAGSIVAWTIALSKPTASQTTFFNEHEGGAAAAQLGILAPKTLTSKKSAASAGAAGASRTKTKTTHKKPAAESEPTEYTLVATSPVVELEPYFGETAEFPLETTMKVQPGDVVALTVPTWAPALALGFGKTTGWRASRPKSGCAETSVQTAHLKVGVNRPYACVYHEARLTYSATLISTP
jgi:hypothetical protein